MEFLIFLFIGIVLFGSGFAFRGLIGRELKVISADLKTEFAALKSAVEKKL